ISDVVPVRRMSADIVSPPQDGDTNRQPENPTAPNWHPRSRRFCGVGNEADGNFSIRQTPDVECLCVARHETGN
ncbi:MAG: hypothetical protein O9272_11265, partial [Brevundimonas sp.]|nr:hypothetical protein [Brevundimonas sp.]